MPDAFIWRDKDNELAEIEAPAQVEAEQVGDSAPPTGLSAT